MRFKLIMFDLDGTLGYLEGKEGVDQFLIKLYTKKLSKSFQIPEEKVRNVLIDVFSHIKNTPKLPRTISEVMFYEISRRLNVDEREVRNVTDSFYNREFNEMKKRYRPIDGAKEAIEIAFHLVPKVVIATDPIVRRSGVLKRLRWINLIQYPYSFITSADDNHATKPHLEFYREILDRCNCDPNESIMVGNRVKNDIIPAKKLGILTIHIKDEEDPFSPEADYNANSIKDVPAILRRIFAL